MIVYCVSWWPWGTWTLNKPTFEMEKGGGVHSTVSFSFAVFHNHGDECFLEPLQGKLILQCMNLFLAQMLTSSTDSQPPREVRGIQNDPHRRCFDLVWIFPFTCPLQGNTFSRKSPCLNVILMTRPFVGNVRPNEGVFSSWQGVGRCEKRQENEYSRVHVHSMSKKYLRCVRSRNTSVVY